MTASENIKASSNLCVFILTVFKCSVWKFGIKVSSEKKKLCVIINKSKLSKEEDIKGLSISYIGLFIYASALWMSSFETVCLVVIVYTCSHYL